MLRDSEATHRAPFEMVLNLMQKIQGLGHPPKDLARLTCLGLKFDLGAFILQGLPGDQWQAVSDHVKLNTFFSPSLCYGKHLGSAVPLGTEAGISSLGDICPKLSTSHSRLFYKHYSIMVSAVRNCRIICQVKKGIPLGAFNFSFLQTMLYTAVLVLLLPRLGLQSRC